LINLKTAAKVGEPKMGFIDLS